MRGGGFQTASDFVVGCERGVDVSLSRVQFADGIKGLADGNASYQKKDDH
jgi:hypothetical protein